MRKHDARKWLHAVLDLLPVILIPVFMIYSHRHTIDSYEITTDKYQVVDFNQLIPNDQRTYINDDLTDQRDYTTFVVQVFQDDVFKGELYADYNQSVGHLETIVTSYINGNSVRYKHSGSLHDLVFCSFSADIVSGDKYLIDIDFLHVNPSVIDGFETNNNQFVNLSRMFGLGNEPTVQEFNTYYPNDYYDYTLSQKQLLNLGTETLNNNDIGSQFVYAMYQPIHDYFNFNNVFNFNAIYDWMQLNIFNGTAPLTFFIVWNIVLYEFIMDLVFLIYALFMFFIDFCTNLIDRFHCKCSGGK